MLCVKDSVAEGVHRTRGTEEGLVRCFLGALVGREFLEKIT